MRFDDILMKYIGQIGRYQTIQYILVGLPTIFTALHSLSWTFTASKTHYRCLYPGENSTDPYGFNDTWLKHATNVSHPDSHGDSCNRLANVSFHQPVPENVTLETCKDGYAWGPIEMDYSAIQRWNLVCDNNIFRSIVQATYYVGQFFGSLVFGILADKIGRKPVFIMAILLQIACGTAMAFVPWLPLFAILRIGVGFAHPGIFMIAVIIGAELVGPKYRVVSTTGAGIFFALGEVILGSLAYGLLDYRYLQLAISLPALVFLIYWWLIPESARWLLSRGRVEDADHILQRVARFNNREPLPSDWYEHLQQDKTKQTLTWGQGFLALFRTPNIRKRTLITFVVWPVVSMTFYGLAINPSFLGGDNRLGFIVGGALEVPGIIFVLFALNIVGRKYLTSGGFLLAAACLLSTMAIPDKVEYGKMILVVIGKSALTAVYATVYVMTPEHYPTMIRNTATGACSMIARAGGVSASFMSLYLAETHPKLVSLIFAGLTIVAGLLAIFLPETTGEHLMETIEEAEEFGKDQPIFISGHANQQRVKARFNNQPEVEDRRRDTIE